MIQYDKLYEMRDSAADGWGKRIVYELLYLCELSATENGKYDTDISRAVDGLYEDYKKEGSITAAACLRTESELAHLSARVKKLEVIAAAHAHSDMNWMWGYNETVSIVLSTFRTMLSLLKEYPQFTFSQSMASTYRIVEKHQPEMLAEIKKYIDEGRWEITASEWTECDKNMIDGESQVRHVLYTRQYLSKLFGLDENDFDIAFEPDTFGHNRNLPELLAHCGVKYYYFCRGIEAGTDIFRFTAPSGSQILALREAHWYNSDIKENDILSYPQYARKNKLDKVLKVYGVGDHGGGPTRKDIEKILEFDSWPLFPRFRFGTFKEFFTYIDGKEWPVIDKELNFLNHGCYTSQAKIKAQNKRCTRRLVAAETLNALGGVCAGVPSRAEELKNGWEHVLFNHFHDILPGSCTTESRERALGIYQETLAIADTVASSSALKIVENIDYSAYEGFSTVPGKKSTAEGAGGGYLSASGLTINSNPAAGPMRIFTIFNTSQYVYDGVAELQIWDYETDMRKIEVKDGAGNALEFEVVDFKGIGYWGHEYKRLLVRLSVPAFGYGTVIVSQKPNVKEPIVIPDWERTDPPVKYVLENEYLRAEFSSLTLALVSLYDKESGTELIGGGGARLRFLEEDTTRYMTSWITGRIKKINELSGVICRPECYKTGNLRSFIVYEAKFGENSNVKTTVTLNKGSRFLEFSSLVDFREFGRHETCVPQLEFFLPLPRRADGYVYDIANACIRREPGEAPVPAINWAYPESAAGGVQLISADRNGFTGDGESLRLALIRASFEPDPTPETGYYVTDFALTVGGDAQKLFRNAAEYLARPLILAARAGKGSLPAEGSLLQAEGAVVTAVKNSEKGDGIVVRLYEETGAEKTVKIAMPGMKRCVRCTGDERETEEISVTKGAAAFAVGAYSTVTVKIT